MVYNRGSFIWGRIVEYLGIPVILVFSFSLLPLLFYGYNAGRRSGYRAPGATVIVLMSWAAVFYCIYTFAPERISHSTHALYFTLYFFLMPAVLSTAFCALVARLLLAGMSVTWNTAPSRFHRHWWKP
jgi:hypothetical protein